MKLDIEDSLYQELMDQEFIYKVEGSTVLTKKGRRALTRALDIDAAADKWKARFDKAVESVKEAVQ